MTADHALPPPDKWSGREITPDDYAHDWKLREDKKANWPSHLAEIVHSYNATQSAVTVYSPHYLMFGCRPRLVVNFVSPPLAAMRPPQERPLPSMWMCT